MLEFLKRLVGSSSDERSGTSNVVARYFKLSADIEAAKADKNYGTAVSAARETYRLFPEFVQEWKREYGKFDIGMSHAVHTVATLMAVMGERVGLGELRDVLSAIPDLHAWLPSVDEADRDAGLVDGILGVVEQSPGVRQLDLKKQLGVRDARRLSTLAEWLEKAGRLRRVRTGSTYQLFPSTGPDGGGLSTGGEDSALRQVAPPIPPRPRQRRNAERPHVIDLSSLAYVRLPMAPPAWEERRRQEAEGKPGRSDTDSSPPLFSVDVPGWQVREQNRLPTAERPDPAFKEAFPTSGWTHWLDPKGRREGHPDSSAVLRVTDRTGRVVAERGLARDVYRADVNTDGSAIIFLSRDGVLHAYDHQVESILSESLVDTPEYLACAERLGIPGRELKNHVRCVAISADAGRYLYTVVDEAWCMSLAGEVLWGLRMPTQEGWTRVASPRSPRAGTSNDVDEALRLMNLSYPVTPDSVTQQYRRLAMQWHPDRNPGDGEAVPRMQRLNAAMELLTGVDLSSVSGDQVETATYQRILSTHLVDVPGGGRLQISIGLGMSEKSAADWIYAANFGWRDNRVFVASYSGKVVEVSSSGTPVRVYDIGAVPRHIADTGAFLYLLTDTRLYVLAGERLEGVIDVFDRGDLLLADRGFGLLGTRLFTWFSPEGRRIGGASTKDPIRRVFSTDSGLVIETRQHRGTIAGAPPWWEPRTSSDEG